MGAKFVCFRCVIDMWRSNTTGFGKGLKCVTPHRFDSIGYQYGHLKKKLWRTIRVIHIWFYSFQWKYVVFDLHIEPLDNNAWNGFHYKTSFQSKSNQVLFIWLLPIMSCRAQGDSSGCWCREGGNGAWRQSNYTTMMDATVSGAAWGSKWWRVAGSWKPLADLMWEQEENVRVCSRCDTEQEGTMQELAQENELSGLLSGWKRPWEHYNTNTDITIFGFVLEWNGGRWLSTASGILLVWACALRITAELCEWWRFKPLAL
jgi:hypothetical protein